MRTEWHRGQVHNWNEQDNSYLPTPPCQHAPWPFPPTFHTYLQRQALGRRIEQKPEYSDTYTRAILYEEGLDLNMTPALYLLKYLLVLHFLPPHFSTFKLSHIVMIPVDKLSVTVFCDCLSSPLENGQNVTLTDAIY